MPKESRRCSSRASNRQRCCEDSDDGKKPCLRDTPKISGNSVNRFAPFQREIPRRESRSNEEENFTTLVHSNEKSGGIIENGMKYIMFPLHLLRFCIFGTTTLSVDDGKNKDRKEIEAIEKKSEKKREEKEIRERKDEAIDSREKEDKVGKRTNDDSNKLLKDKTKSRDVKSGSEERRDSEDRRKSSDRDERVSERSNRKERSRSKESRRSFSPRRTDDDSDSSSCDKWSTAESSMDVSIDYESTYESMSYRLEEPMDISIEESIDENVLSSTRIVSHRTGNSRTVGPSASSSSSWSNEESSSSSSIEEEISRVFQRKCTSSSSDNDDSSSSTGHRDKRRDNSDKRDRKDREVVASRESTAESKEKSEKGEIKSSTRRKDESYREKTLEKRTSSTSTTSSERNSSPRRASRTPVKSKDTRKRYKEKGVQTDSAFSDDDVEMIPLDARLTEKRASNRGYRRKLPSVSYQIEGMDPDILYIADNEDSNDGCERCSRNRISPVSESSSSTDHGFEDQRYLTRNCRAHVDERERAKNSLRDDTTIKDLSKKIPLPRAPPGFPKVPQNPPISLKSWNNPSTIEFPFSTETSLTISQYGQSYPPAPTPMRHLYHEYPEFMPFPEEIGSLQIFQTISTNGYLC